MKLVARTWIAAALVATCSITTAPAGEAEWKAEHDAGWNAYKEGRLDEAKTRLRAAEKEARALGENDPRLATTLDHLAWVLSSEGKIAEAEPLAKSALAIREKAFGPEHPEVVLSLNTLASIYDLAGRPSEARPIYARCLATAEKVHGPEHPSVAADLDNLAAVDHVLGKSEEAEASYKRAIAIREKTAGGKPIDLAPTLHNLGTLYIEKEKYAEAEPLLRRAPRHPGASSGGGPPGRRIKPRGARVAVRQPGETRRGGAVAQKGARSL